MRFEVEPNASVLPAALVYRSQDYSFDVEPKPEGGGASLLVNDLQLEVDDEGKLLYAWAVPAYRLVEHDR